MLIRAVDRWSDPAHVDTGLMLAVAVVGAVANTIGLLILRGGKDESLNLRGAYLEVLGDLLGSVAVVVAALVIMLTGWTRADSIASLAIVVLILPRAWSLLRDVVDVLLEATPKGVDLDDVREHIREVPGVVDVHDLHAWTITSGVPVLSAHVVVDDACIADGPLRRGAGPAGRVPGRPLRRRALHLPARAGRSRRARGRPACVTPSLGRACADHLTLPRSCPTVESCWSTRDPRSGDDPRAARARRADDVGEQLRSSAYGQARGLGRPIAVRRSDVELFRGARRAAERGRLGHPRRPARSASRRWRLTRSDWLSARRTDIRLHGVDAGKDALGLT